MPTPIKLTVRIRPEDVRPIFKAAKSQIEYLEGIYKLVYPNWDDIETLSDHPICNEFTWKAICRYAMDWDHEHCPRWPGTGESRVMPGGAWMNSGFTTLTGHNLENWEIIPCEAILKSRSAEPSVRAV